MHHKTKFQTKDEALAYIRGMEDAIAAIDDDHLVVEAHPHLVDGYWVVKYSYHC